MIREMLRPLWDRPVFYPLYRLLDRLYLKVAPHAARDVCVWCHKGDMTIEACPSLKTVCVYCCAEASGGQSGCCS